MRRLVVDGSTELRALNRSDASKLFGLIDANRAHLRRRLLWLDANASVGDTLDFIERAATLESMGRGLVVGIEHLGALAGVMGFNVIDPDNRSAELGYWLAQDRMGQGIATRSARALARHAFDELGLHRITIPVEVDNHGSRAVAERLGAREEGIMRDAVWLYDRYADLVLYALLDDELSA